MSLDEITYALFAKTASLVEKHGGRAYPLEAPETGVSLPYIVYSRVSDVPIERTLRGRPATRNALVQVELFAANINSMTTLEDAVDLAVEAVQFDADSDVIGSTFEKVNLESSDVKKGPIRSVFNVRLIYKHNL